jgi:hypothetical protein
MIDLDNIHQFTTPRPDLNFTGTGKDFDALPPTHKEQILFLNSAADKFIFEFASSARLLTGGFWNPFEKGNFKTVETFDHFYGIRESQQELKKWLFNRGIPFDTWVFVLMGDNSPAMLMTWKMMLKCVAHLFFGYDVMVFDKTTNWCLVYFHENEMFFGKDKVFDATEDEEHMKALNERKKKYPDFKHPYL